MSCTEVVIYKSYVLLKEWAMMHALLHNLRRRPHFGWRRHFVSFDFSQKTVFVGNYNAQLYVSKPNVEYVLQKIICCIFTLSSKTAILLFLIFAAWTKLFCASTEKINMQGNGKLRVFSLGMFIALQTQTNRFYQNILLAIQLKFRESTSFGEYVLEQITKNTKNSDLLPSFVSNKGAMSNGASKEN